MLGSEADEARTSLAASRPGRIAGQQVHWISTHDAGVPSENRVNVVFLRCARRRTAGQLHPLPSAERAEVGEKDRQFQSREISRGVPGPQNRSPIRRA